MSPYCLRPLWGSTFTYPSLSTRNLTVTWILIRDVCPLWIPYLALVVKPLGPCYVHVLSVRIMYSHLWMRYFRWIKGVLMWCPEYDIFVPIIVPRSQSWLCTGVPELRHNCVSVKQNYGYVLGCLCLQMRNFVSQSRKKSRSWVVTSEFVLRTCVFLSCHNRFCVLDLSGYDIPQAFFSTTSAVCLWGRM